MDKIGEFELNKVYCMDCLEGLKKIPDNSIDLVFTDPPYNVEGQVFKFGKKQKSTKFEWDSEFSNNKEYIKWCLTWLEHLQRVCKGSLIIWIKYSDAAYYINYLESKGWKHKAGIVWHKTNPMPQIRKKNYLMSYETCLWFVKDNKNYTFNFSKQTEMHNFFESPICMGKERLKHPSQKPLKLTKWIVSNHSNKGDIILDIFAGSGSHILAAQQLGRRFIGFEINKEYFKIVEKRISQTQLNTDFRATEELVSIPPNPKGIGYP